MSMNQTKIVYFSKYFNVQNFIDYFMSNAETYPIKNDGTVDIEGDFQCILILPSYESDYMIPLLDFVDKYKHNIKGMIGSGDRNYHELYLFSAFELEIDYGIPVLGGFENMGMQEDADAILKIAKAIDNNEPIPSTHFDCIHEDRESYLANRKDVSEIWQSKKK